MSGTVQMKVETTLIICVSINMPNGDAIWLTFDFPKNTFDSSLITYVLISTQDTQSFVIVIFIDLNFGSFFGNLRLILQSFFK